MKVGDVVMFIGFEGVKDTSRQNEVKDVGIIVKVHEVYGKKRYDVSWPGGSFGSWLYPETLEMISENW